MNNESMTQRLPEELEQAIARIKKEDGKRMDPQQRKEIVKMVFDALKDEFVSLGASYEVDIDTLYRSLPDGSFIVRREDPERVIRAVAQHTDLSIGLDPTLAHHGAYANSVEWSRRDGSRGLDTAFLEGVSHLGGIVTVVGSVPGADLEVRSVTPERTPSARGTDRRLVRSVSGRIHPEDIRFVVLRIPSQFFPEDELTDAEQEALDEAEEAAPRRPIFRGFRFPDVHEQRAA